MNHLRTALFTVVSATLLASPAFAGPGRDKQSDTRGSRDDGPSWQTGGHSRDKGGVKDDKDADTQSGWGGWDQKSKKTKDEEKPPKDEYAKSSSKEDGEKTGPAGPGYGKEGKDHGRGPSVEPRGSHDRSDVTDKPASGGPSAPQGRERTEKREVYRNGTSHGRPAPKYDVVTKPAGPKETGRNFRPPARQPKPVAFKGRNDILRTPKDRSFAPPPRHDDAGKPFKGSISYRPPPREVNIFNNVTITNRINVYNRTERVRGRYYWHHDGGHRICHYYDYGGLHWYGWHVGLSFYWTRWHAGYWWWYDRHFDRWCYWHSGYWWWPRPGYPNVVYVYINNEYRPAEEVPAETVELAVPPLPEEAPSQPADHFFRNKAMDRMVRIYGEDRDAFLYDASDKPTFRPIFLASGVKDVQMSDDANGKPLQILVTKEDGSFEVFDGQGRPYVPSAPPKR